MHMSVDQRLDLAHNYPKTRVAPGGSQRQALEPATEFTNPYTVSGTGNKISAAQDVHVP